MWFHVHVYFKSPYYSDTSSCVTYSQTDTLNVPSVLRHWISKQVDDGPLWGLTMPDRRVIFNGLLLVKFSIFLGISDFVFITPNSDSFLIAGHPATNVGKFWQGCLLMSDIRSGDIARSCSGSFGNLQGLFLFSCVCAKSFELAIDILCYCDNCTCSTTPAYQKIDLFKRTFQGNCSERVDDALVLLALALFSFSHGKSLVLCNMITNLVNMISDFHTASFVWNAVQS